MKTKSLLLPKQQRQVDQLGERLKLARLRRRLSAQMVADRAGMSRATLGRIEQGESAVSFAHYFQVLKVLGLEKDVDGLAADDEMGRKLQDLELVTPKRISKSRNSE